jgi:hypothetical protein
MHLSPLALSLHVTLGAFGFNTGNDLWYICQDKSQELACLGYIQGLVAGATMYAGVTTPFCMPDGVAVGQAEDIVLSYLAAHPDRRHYDARVIVALALKEAFPCK